MWFFLIILAFPLQSEAAYWSCSTAASVCGTDGKTYKDICEFNAAKVSDPDLQVLYEGSCVEHKMLQGSADLEFQNIPQMAKAKLDEDSNHKSKKYVLHFRTFAKSNAMAMLDDCPRKCYNVCPQNIEEATSTLYFTKLCLDCCNDFN